MKQKDCGWEAERDRYIKQVNSERSVHGAERRG